MGGELQRIPTSFDDELFLFVREKNGDRVFVGLNLSGENLEFSLDSDSDIWMGEWNDVFSGEDVTLSKKEIINLPAWGYVVYEGI